MFAKTKEPPWYWTVCQVVWEVGGFGRLLPDNGISINPLNWKRDDTYAPASENLGDKMPVLGGQGIAAIDYKIHHPGLADAQVDLERGSAICTNLSDKYVKPLVPGIPDLFGPASLHLSDYPAYWENIRENVQTRIKAYFSKKS